MKNKRKRKNKGIGRIAPIYSRSSLFRRYFRYTAAIVTACMLILGLVMVIFISGQWWTDKTDALTINARNVIPTAVECFENPKLQSKTERQLLENTLHTMATSSNADYFLVNAQGEVIVCEESVNKQCQTHDSFKVPKKYMTLATKSGFSNYINGDGFGIGKFVVAVPITIKNAEDSKNVPVAVFAVENAIEGLLPYVLSILGTVLYSTLAILALSSIVIYILCRAIAVPLNEMQEVTTHIAKGEFEYRANEAYRQSYFADFAKALNKMADELAINEEAQRSFIANVSHELKTPMTTIGGFIDGILDGTIQKEQERNYLTIVSNEVRRLARTVVSMLNLSKIEAGEVSLSPTNYDVSKQIFEILLSFEKRINEKNINIMGFEDMENIRIYADRDLLQQVIYNLFDNAVKFTPKDGEITIIVEGDKEKTSVIIRNTGVSVSNGEISRIFERFYKVDKSRSYDVKGVGLGLYIVKTIVNMHGGEITASSVEGEYTQFRFEIPTEAEARKSE